MEQKIKKIVESLGIGYIFDDWSRANLKADKPTILYPLCVNLLPVSGTFSFYSGIVKDSPNCLFAFLDKTDLDFDGKENSEIVERMKNLALKFIAKLNSSGVFEPIEGDIRYSVVYDKLDVNLTGITIEITLKPLRGICEETL